MTWRGYDHNGECLDCDEWADSHAPECPYWKEHTYYLRTRLTTRPPFWMENARRKQEPPDMELRMTNLEAKKFKLQSDHPMANDSTTCPACHKTFAGGDLVTLVLLGPGDDPEERALARAGRPFNGIALPVHWACATGEEG